MDEYFSLRPPRSPRPELELVYRCPRDGCGHLFIGRYRHPLNAAEAESVGGDNTFILFDIRPSTPRPPNVPSEVADISPGFFDIYSQSLAAESFELMQIAGVGFRKALEFLIKDYCIKNNPSAAEDIRRSFLGNCIKEHVTDTNIKRCAERAVWLGNDETHYTKKWQDKDIRDLKMLVELTIDWTNNEILTHRTESQRA